MKHKLSTIIATAVMAVAMISCGDSHRAHSLIDDYMEQHIAFDDYSVDRYSPIDSTFRITPQTIGLMKKAIDATHYFRQAPFAANPLPTKLLYVNVKGKQGGKPFALTFYFDPALTKVVAVKEN